MKYYITILLVFMTSASFAKDPIIIAHRGASGYEPENSLRAFERAIAMGAPIVELDVHLSKSGDLIVFHDTTTSDNKKVSDLTIEELKKYDLGKGERIPLLSEVLDLVNKRATILIELKSRGTAKPIAQLLDQYIKDKNWSHNNFIVASFDHPRVQEFHKYAPTIPTSVIFEGNPIDLAQISTRAGADHAMLYYEWITPEFVKDAHERGVKVFTYTVNDKEIAKQMLSLQVDGIITNYPDLLQSKGQN